MTLLSCPFTGRAANGPIRQGDGDWRIFGGLGFYVQAPTKDAVVAMWNMRTAAGPQQQVETLAAALQRLTSACSAMLTGISIHNALSEDAPARRDDIKGEVVNALSDATHNARRTLMDYRTGADADITHHDPNGEFVAGVVEHVITGLTRDGDTQ